MLTEHDKLILRVLKKSVERTDRHRAKGADRIKTLKLIKELEEKQDDDNTATIQG